MWKTSKDDLQKKKKKGKYSKWVIKTLRNLMSFRVTGTSNVDGPVGYYLEEGWRSSMYIKRSAYMTAKKNFEISK